MHKPEKPRLLMLLAVIAIIASGCDENARLAELAMEAADRQAEQNEEMARLNREVAEGTKHLVEADAQARRELTEMQRDLQGQQAEIGDQRDLLEMERQEIAGERLTESRLGPILKSCAVAAVCAVTIGFCWCLLFGLNQDDETDQVLGELLVEELVSDKPKILPPAQVSGPPAIEHKEP